MQMQGKSNTNHRIKLATLLFYRFNMDVLTVTFAIKSKVRQANALSILRMRGRFWLYDLKGSIMLCGKV
jgi:hypothetical protein